MNNNIRKILLFGKFKNIDDVFKHYRKNKYFHNIIVCFYFYQLMLNCVSYEKNITNITNLQKIFFDIVKKYSANKKYLSLKPSENMFNYEDKLLSKKTFV